MSAFNLAGKSRHNSWPEGLDESLIQADERLQLNNVLNQNKQKRKNNTIIKLFVGFILIVFFLLIIIINN